MIFYQNHSRCNIFTHNSQQLIFYLHLDIGKSTDTWNSPKFFLSLKYSDFSISKKRKHSKVRGFSRRRGGVGVQLTTPTLYPTAMQEKVRKKNYKLISIRRLNFATWVSTHSCRDLYLVNSRYLQFLIQFFVTE